MIERTTNTRNQVEVISLESHVRQDHLLRKIDSAMDYTHIYDFVDDLYCRDNGRPSVDPVVLFKIVLLQHIYGIPSLRQTMREIEDNVAYRWFLGYCLNEPIPHFSTVSYNFLHRFKDDTIEQVFRWILYEIERSGYLSPEMVFIDATHVRANANIKKKCKREIPKAAYAYEQQLKEEINADRQAHGKSCLMTMIKTTGREQKRRRSQQPTLTVAFCERASTKCVLRMERIPRATVTISFLGWRSAQATCMTA